MQVGYCFTGVDMPIRLIAFDKTKGVNLESNPCMTPIVSIVSDFNQMTIKRLPINNDQYHSIVN